MNRRLYKRRNLRSIFEAKDLEQLIAAGKKFGTIYADPPWQYGNQGTRAATYVFRAQAMRTHLEKNNYRHTEGRGSDNHNDCILVPIRIMSSYYGSFFDVCHIDTIAKCPILFEMRSVTPLFNAPQKPKPAQTGMLF